MLAELAIINGAIATIKTTITHGHDLSKAAKSIAKFVTAEEDLRERANAKKNSVFSKLLGKDSNDFEEFMYLEEIEQKKQALAQADEFSSIRSLWAGCAACHGVDGGGGVGPMLAGQSADDIINKLTIYKNRGQIGAQSALMWGQAGMLTEQEIETIGKFVQGGMPK